MKEIFKVIGIVVVIMTISVTIAIFSTSTQFEESMMPSIEDNLYPTDQSLINLDNSDIPQISEFSEILNKNTNYIIDENGNKQYILNVTDTPTLED